MSHAVHRNRPRFTPGLSPLNAAKAKWARGELLNWTSAVAGAQHFLSRWRGGGGVPRLGLCPRGGPPPLWSAMQSARVGWRAPRRGGLAQLVESDLGEWLEGVTFCWMKRPCVSLFGKDGVGGQQGPNMTGRVGNSMVSVSGAKAWWGDRAFLPELPSVCSTESTCGEECLTAVLSVPSSLKLPERPPHADRTREGCPRRRHPMTTRLSSRGLCLTLVDFSTTQTWQGS